ncbi:MAG: DUF72 domain-containing protein [Gemmatales bacterium]|nr:DUF72 domain-containing protein [Gemmatales bacterium]MDW8388079.1 DUF72 domain-containing protein [Gemmatales bacterium]
MHPVRIGACGWSYPEWVGPFFPEGTPAGEFLARYAEHFDVVEVDSTFYRIPSRRMVQNWADRTPESFGFALKVPQVITHEKLLVECEGEVHAFTEAIRSLGPKLLCCCLQFPYLNRTKVAGQADFLHRLDTFLGSWPREFPIAVEIRNKSWMNPKLADALRRHQAVLVLTDQAWMPSPLSVMQSFDAVTGSFAYVRLLGNREEVEKLTQRFDHIVVDRSANLAEDAEAIQRLRERVPVLAFVNNHYAGFAPETIRQLRRALGLPT